jgi:DNA (cytosine-5)-methyltransferase 1
MKTTNYLVARQKVSTFLQSNPIPAIAGMEDATVSHWIQTPDASVYTAFSPVFRSALSGSTKIARVSEGSAGYNRPLFDLAVPFPPPKKPAFTFIDLFAGIGGFRIAMQEFGGKCVYSSEWDSAAQRTYDRNYGEIPFGDITGDQVKAMIPETFDVLCGGFPCQAFSIAGYREGFNDKKHRGGLFFEIAKILQKHKPQCILLENVKNLQSHDSGKTFTIIREALESLGYIVHSKVMNTMEYGNLPQNRERIYIVGFLSKSAAHRFSFPDKLPLTRTMHSCLMEMNAPDKYYYSANTPLGRQLDREVTKTDTVYQWRRIYVRENKSNVCPTLTANMGMGGHNVPLIRDGKGVRKLTPRECANFQGYPEEFILPLIADSALYKQCGNSVSVPVVKRVARAMKEAMLG